jgi:hypothetical protein
MRNLVGHHPVTAQAGAARSCTMSSDVVMPSRRGLAGKGHGEPGEAREAAHGADVVEAATHRVRAGLQPKRPGTPAFFRRRATAEAQTGSADVPWSASLGRLPDPGSGARPARLPRAAQAGAGTLRTAAMPCQVVRPSSRRGPMRASAAVRSARLSRLCTARKSSTCLMIAREPAASGA